MTAATADPSTQPEPSGGSSTANAERDRVKVRGNLAWIAASAAAYSAYVGIATAFPVEDDTQPNLKVWLALVTVIGAIVQIATISRVYNWSKRIPPGAVATLSKIHRWSGRTTLLVGGCVTYLCMTGPFAAGFTLHRLFGYILVFTVLVKVVILRVADRFSGLLPFLGLLAAAGWTACFLTKAIVIWFG